MSEENQVANEGAVDSTATADPEVNASSAPEGAEPSTSQPKGNETSPENVPFHKHPRWQEMMDKNRNLERQVSELHSRMSGGPAKDENPADEILSDFTKAGLNPELAKVISNGIVKGSTKVADKRVAPLESSTLQQEVSNAVRTFAAAHKDYEQLKPQMAEVYENLPKDLADAIAMDRTGKSLELIYNHVKAVSVKEIEEAAFKKGIQEGFKQKQLKTSVSPSGGSSAPQTKGEYSDKDIDEMSVADYKKLQAEILKSRGIRKLR